MEQAKEDSQRRKPNLIKVAPLRASNEHLESSTSFRTPPQKSTEAQQQRSRQTANSGENQLRQCTGRQRGWPGWWRQRRRPPREGKPAEGLGDAAATRATGRQVAAGTLSLTLSLTHTLYDQDWEEDGGQRGLDDHRRVQLVNAGAGLATGGGSG